MNIKLFASDLDGTLLNNQHTISQRSACVIRGAQESGKLFLVATGRAWNTTKPLLQKAGISCGAILLNGAEFRTADGSLIFQETIEKKAVREIMDILIKTEVDFEINTECGDFSTDLSVCQLAKPFPDDVKLFTYKAEVQKLDVFSHKVGLLKKIRESLQKVDGIFVTSSALENIEITAENAQKDRMLKRAVAWYGIAEKETAVFGDGENDRQMLKHFHFSFAVENAIDEVKKCAAYVIGTNRNNGVAIQIEKILMEEKKNVIF